MKNFSLKQASVLIRGSGPPGPSPWIRQCFFLICDRPVDVWWPRSRSLHFHSQKHTHVKEHLKVTINSKEYRNLVHFECAKIRL